MPERIRTYAEFWPFYLRQHSRKLTRALHIFGTGLAILLLLGAIALGRPTLLLAAVIAGYGFAWLGHFAVEKNRPATFSYPLWSFVSDVRMFWLWASGRLGSELARHQIR